MTSSGWRESAPRGIPCGRPCPAACVRGGGLVARYLGRWPTSRGPCAPPARGWPGSPSPFASAVSRPCAERDGGGSSATPQCGSGVEAAPPGKRNGGDGGCGVRTSITCHPRLRVLRGEQPRTWAVGQGLGPHPDPPAAAGLSLLCLGTPFSKGYSQGDKRVVPAVK